MLFVVPHAGYPFDVLVAIGAPHEKILAWLSKNGCALDEDDRELVKLKSGAKGRTIMLGSGQSIIQLVRLNGSADDAGHLAHEVFHAVDFLMARIGITLSRNSDEAYAYAIGNLTSRIMARAKRR